MNALLRPYRLVPRGGAGLACDENGLALGNADLARVSRDAVGAGRCDVRSVEELGRLLSAAYGPRTDAEVLRLHRGLCRAAAQIGCGDLGLACIEAVMLGLPDLTADAMSKLAAIADLEKGANDAWETEPRIPSGQNGGGQWTTGGTTSAPTASDSPGRSEPEPRALGPISSDSGRAGEGSSAPGGSRSSDAIDANLLTPVSTAGAVVGERGMAGDFALPENAAGGAVDT